YKWRVYRDGRPTLDRVLDGLKALQRNGVETNALTMVTSHSWDKPQMIWDFLREQDISFFQFIPCLERDQKTGEKSRYSVEPEQYGEFMCHMFDLWSEPECPETYVRMFNDLVEMYAGNEGPSCINKERCGEYVVIEHNGDVYACDFFVDEDHYIGNLLKTPLKDLVHSEKMEEFALAKGEAGPECEECPWWDICHGGCPKDRVYATGRTDCATYLCEGYKMLFEHADSRLRELAQHYQEEQAQMRDGHCLL
ncbi:MAG: SPASM domain-containing protein, partial [Armatimonadota bacterium]